MVSASEAVSDASSSRAGQRWLTGRVQKWTGILGYPVKARIVTIPHRYRRKAATYGHEPINLRNGKTRQWLSLIE
jgi:hypothetical protein